MYILGTFVALICSLCVAAHTTRDVALAQRSAVDVFDPFTVTVPRSPAGSGNGISITTTFSPTSNTSTTATTLLPTATTSTTTTTPSPPALRCGPHAKLAAGKGFSICDGHWITTNFCCPGLPGIPRLLDQNIVPQSLYFPLQSDSGVVINLHNHSNPDLCDYSSKPPQTSWDRGSACDAHCHAILGAITNDCDTRTTTAKMGGTMVVGCNVWSILSISREASKPFQIFSNDYMPNWIKECAENGTYSN